MSKPYTPQASQQFERDVKAVFEKGYDLSELKTLMTLLIHRKPLNNKYQDHPLRGRLKRFRDAHISNDPDWILIYRYADDDKKIIFERTGTHGDIFKPVKKS
ncbi:MAG: type II toxin-antitoxin system YafQ family toxin [Candidatus Adiutrix sp.]|jgi:mRNA interferase YafQ|nr:type II toxin-antitoxin system YafQ family toxin [Candidatus Adiutrix sp.]